MASAYYQRMREQVNNLNKTTNDSQRYVNIYNDMITRPQEYYSAFNGSMTKYRNQLDRMEYMAGISSIKLPDRFTHYAYLFDDMQTRKDLYLQELGSERAYKNQLSQVDELYRLERENTAPVLSLISGRAPASFLTETGLSQFYTYDSSNGDDAILAELGYAPTSFDYSVSDLGELQQAGYQAENFFTANDDGTLTDQAQYLATLYQYDMNDPEDALNQALGLMPKSFKYDNTDEDIIRENNGQLPFDAETYVLNSERFAAEYEEYATKQQEYADALYAWEYGPKTGFLGIFRSAKPTNPYADESTIPVSVQDVLKYKLSLSTPKETTYNTDTASEVRAPNFYFGSLADLQLYVSDTDFDMLTSGEAGYFQASEDVLARQKYIEEAESRGLVDTFIAQNKSNYVETKMESYYIEELKSRGQYEAVMAQSEEMQKDLTAALSGEATPEKIALLKENQDAVEALIGTAFDWGGLIEYGTAGISNEIKTQLKALGWNGELESDNPQIQALLDRAAYSTLSNQYYNAEIIKKNMAKNPAWLNAIWTGMDSGVNNIKSDLATVAFKGAQLMEINPEIRERLGELAMGVAESSQLYQSKNLEYIEAGTGSKEGTQTIYGIVSTATELGIELALGNALGSLGAGASVAATTKTASTVGRLAKKALFSKQLIPYFVASLGSNLMEGQLEGRTDLENWSVSLLTAYMESKTESMFGFFSKGGSAYKIFKNGIGKLSAETLNSVARTLLENTLGETFEEIIQDVTGNIIEGTITGETDPMDLGGTITTTMGVGLLLSLFGLPAGIKSYTNARTVQSAFNEMVAAYENGDMVAYNKAVGKMKESLPKALEAMQTDFLDGSIDRVAELITINSNLEMNLNEMNNAIVNAVDLRQRKESGEAISQAAINFADARVNQAVSVLKSEQGANTMPATLYDQVSNSPELTAMLNADGLASSLIRNNSGNRLTDTQVKILRQISDAAKANPYVNVIQMDEKAGEKLRAAVDKAKNNYQTMIAQREQMGDALQSQINEGRKLKGEAKKTAASEIAKNSEQFYAMDAEIRTAQQKVADAQQALEGYQLQQKFRTAFNKAATTNNTNVTTARTSPVEAATLAEGQTVAGEGEGGVHTERNASQQAAAEKMASVRENVLEDIVTQEFKRKNPVVSEVSETAKEEWEDRLKDEVKDINGLYKHAHDLQQKIEKMGEKAAESDSKKYNKLYGELQRAVDKLMSKLNLSSIVDTLYTYYPRGKFRHNIETHEGQFLSNYSKVKSGEADNTNTPQYTLANLDQAFDVINRGMQVANEVLPMTDKAITTLKNNEREKVRKTLEEPATKKIKKKSYRAFDDLFGVNASNIMQIGLDFDGNDENGIFTQIFNKDASDALEKEARYYVGLSNDTKKNLKGYTGSWLKNFQKNPQFQYVFESGKRVNLTGKEIIMIADNLSGDNNILQGIAFGKQELNEGEYTLSELEDIASVLSETPKSDQAKAIAKQIGTDMEKYVKLKEYLFELDNMDSYKDKYDTEMPAAKELINIASREVYGIERGVRDKYFQRYKKRTAVNVKKKGNAEGNIPTEAIEQARSEDKGMVYFPSLAQYIDNHNYAAAHAAAYDLYLYKLDLIFNGLGVKEGAENVKNNTVATVAETMRKTFGEQYVTRVQKYVDSIIKATEPKSNMDMWWDRRYSKSRARRLLTLPVIAKQWGSIVHAWAYVDGKYLFNPLNIAPLTKEQKKAKYQFAAMSEMRKIGRGTVRELNEDVENRGAVEGLMKVIKWSDTGAIGRLYKGIWRQTKAQNSDLKGDAFYQKVGETFRYVTENTQPTFAPHTTSAFSQEKGFMSKVLTMYSTATNSMFNTLKGSVRDFKTGNYKRSMRKMISALASCAATWGIGKAVDKLIGANDWEDETTVQKIFDVASAFTGMFYGIRTITGTLQYGTINIPVIEEMHEMAQSILTIEYGEITGGVGKYAFDAIDAETEEDRDNATRHMIGAFKKFAVAFASLNGIPVASAEKYIIKPILKIAGGQELLTQYQNLWGYQLNASAQYENLNKAITKGDTDLARQYIKIIINKGGDLDKFLKAKTGGAGLSAEQQYSLTKLWSDVQLEMSLDTVAGGE